MIIIIDYGMGNLGSICNMLKKIGVGNKISSEPDEIRKADKVILPGVGAFDNAVKNIKKLGLGEVLEGIVKEEKTPLLGICLGMQLLSKSSEEGVLKGFGWIDAETKRFSFNNKLKIPHMGWNNIKIQKKDSLLKNMDNSSRFYFVHSYHLVCKNKEDILATTNYGYEFVSMVRKNNVMGAQFHPERSHKFGMQLLKNFAEEK